MIPNGYKKADWLEATHALSNGNVFEFTDIGDNYSRLDSSTMGDVTVTNDALTALGIIPLVKVPDEVTVFVPTHVDITWASRIVRILDTETMQRIEDEPFTLTIKFGEKE